MPEAIQPGKWYLLRLQKLDKKAEKKPFVAIVFECAKGLSTGATFSDNFYLTEKAISRFELLCHRAGSERPIKLPSEVDAALFAAIMGRSVWARVIEDDRYRSLKTDGWNFRAEGDPPEDESFIDYKAADEWESAMEGL